MTLEVCNNYSELVSVCLAYWNSEKKCWISKGWYNIKPDKTVIFKQNLGDYCYLYAKSGDKDEWDGFYYNDSCRFKVVEGNAFEVSKANQNTNQSNSEDFIKLDFEGDESYIFSIEYENSNRYIGNARDVDHSGW